MRAGDAARLACRQSYWAGETDINSCSIGIEIANPGHDCGYPDFPRRQIAAMIALCRGIFTRHRIPADRVLAHSDIAPARKKDPGEKFPWRLLHNSGIGLWVKPTPVTAAGGRIFVLGDRDPEVETLQMSLAISATAWRRPAATMPSPWRWSPPFSATGARPRSTASPTSRRSATLRALLAARKPRSNGST